MSDSRYESRKRWNATNYKQLNIAIRPTLFEEFRTACKQNGISMREALISLMSSYIDAPPAPQNSKDKDYNDRGRRRKAVSSIVNQLSIIRDFEEDYKDNIPDNLRNSSRYEAAEKAIEALEEASEILESAFS